MCRYCERRQDVKFGWEQPKLPYHNNLPGNNLNGNVLENEKWDGTIFDYQTCQPVLSLTCPGYFNGEGVGTIIIPIKYCPECGRKLGKNDEKPYYLKIGDNLGTEEHWFSTEQELNEYLEKVDTTGLSIFAAYLNKIIYNM